MKKYNWFLIIIWVFVVAFCAFNHEIWRDEAQVWCIVRDLNFIDAFNVARSEGHPFLWYLFVMPFAKCGLPVESMQLLSFLFVFISVAFFVIKSPFDNFQKTIICLSAGMLYYLPVVSRNYALIPLIVFLLAYFFNKKVEKPILYSVLLILLSHTHIYMLGFCISLFILLIIDLFKTNKKIVFLPFLLCFLNFLLLFLLFNNAQNENYALENGVKSTLSVIAVFSLIAKVVTYNIAKFSTFLIQYFDVLSILLFYPAVLLFFVGLLKKYRQSAFVFFLSVGYMLFVYTQIYFNGILYQKIFLIYLVMIFCFWISDNKDKLLNYSFSFLFLASMLVSPVIVFEESKYNFSGGKQVANYIKTNLKNETTFISVGNPFLFSTVSAYLPDRKIYNVLTENYITYSTYKTLSQKVVQSFPENVDFNIVVENSDLMDNPYFEFVYSTDDMNLSSKTEREVFKIYKRKKL